MGWFLGCRLFPDYIVSSSALILLALKPGLHFHNIILAGRAWGSHTAAPKMSWLWCWYLEKKKQQWSCILLAICWSSLNMNAEKGRLVKALHCTGCCCCCCCWCSGILPLSVQGSHFVSGTLTRTVLVLNSLLGKIKHSTILFDYNLFIKLEEKALRLRPLHAV